MKSKFLLKKKLNIVWADFYYLLNKFNKLLGIKKKIPNISSCFYTKDKWKYFTGLRSYRIEFWLKAVPIRPPIIKDVFQK